METELGKQKFIGECGACGEKSKLKSGKFAKTNIGIKKQEQWPHLNVWRKYAKKCAFDSLDFELFVAGETRIICNMEDDSSREGRLSVLCKLSHWLCRSWDWTLIRGLYEAIIESVEMGEAEWSDNFDHYESMITPPQSSHWDGKRDKERQHKDKRVEVYWCKGFQKGTCGEKPPHMVTIKGDEPPVLVLHVCTLCLQWEGRREEYPESECLAKK